MSQAQDFFSMIVMQSGWLYGFLSAALLALVGLALRLKKELDRVHAELARAEQKALRASRAKNEFLTNMSHELRTPLNAIIGMTDLLAEAPLDKEQEKYLRICRRASRSLLSIVTDLLDLSQLESGQLEIEIVEFDLRSLVQSVIEMIEIRAFEKGLSLTFTVSPELPRVVRGDFNHLRKILLNLLGNAIKFTEEGQVSLTVAPGLFSSRRESSAADERLGDGDERICFVVRDTGVGIPEAALSTIFDEFTQADASVTRAYGGTGLGLAICHRWVQAMGGIIQVRSRPGQGSEFAVTVPLERPRRLQLLKTSEQSVTATVSNGTQTGPSFSGGGARPRVLLVEDSRDNQALVQAYIRDSDIALEIANNGREACEKLRAERYDLVLMDMQMPVMDGYSATKAIRGWEAETLVQKTPIVALTAHALTEEIRKSLDAGCDGHLAKPVRKRQLLDTIVSWTQAGQSTRG